MQEGEIDLQDNRGVNIFSQTRLINQQQSGKPHKKRDIIAILKSDPQKLKYYQESLNHFTLIKHNLYLDRKRKIPKNDEFQPCYCKPKYTQEAIFEHTNVSYNCDERCLNRMMSTECDDETCNCFQLCLNRKFQKHDYAYVYPMPQGGKGWGLCAGEQIKMGQFIMQYIGEIFSTNSQKGKARIKTYSSSTCTYLMKTSKGQVIDPTYKGNFARFINHSCEPNCITQKWNVLGQICIGIFSLKDIQQNQELTFNYQFDVYSTPLTKCLCGSKRCKGYLGLRPTDITAEQWIQFLQDMTCQICEKNYADDDVNLIICDDCNKGFHIYCLVPALSEIPEQSFFCRNCEEKKKYNEQQNKRKIVKEQNRKLIQTKIQILQDQKCRKQKMSEQEDNAEPFNQQDNRIYHFFKKQQQRALQRLISDKHDQGNLQTPSKQVEVVKRLTSHSKRKDQFSEVTKKAVDKFQNYLQQNQQFYQKINNFSNTNRKQKSTPNQKKNMLLNKIQMQLILKSNFILFEKIGAQIYFDIHSRNSTDFFLKNTEVSVIGNDKQIEMFEQIVNITNIIINQIQVQMGITQAFVSIPAIFIKKLLGPGHSSISQIQKNNQIAVYYHRRFLNEECYPLEVTCKLLLKGGQDNIVRAYEDIKNKLATIEVERIYFNPYEIKTVVNNMSILKRKPGMAQFRISKQSPFKQINHPFYYVQQKNKQVAIIGTRVQIEKTRKQIMFFFEEPNRKQQYNFNISLYLAQPSQKSILLTAKNQLQREIPAIKMMIFDPTPPRKNMTLSFLGTRENRQKAKQYLFSKLEGMNREGKFIGNIEYFQDQMNYQMTKYYFKYMQNTLLTRDAAFMKSWDILNQYYSDLDDNYMWRSVKKHMLADYQTLLYAFFVLKDNIIKKVIAQNGSNNSILQQIYSIITHNVTRILNVYNVNNTSGLKNYCSVIDADQSRKSFKDTYSHITFIKNDHSKVANSQQQPKKQWSFFEKKVFKKYSNLINILEQERQRSRDKQEQRKRDKWR